MTCECCKKGACCINGECTPDMTRTNCENAGGIWQGEDVACEDGDCTDTCCIEYTYCSGYSVFLCKQGYFASNCASGAGCDHTETPVHPLQGTVWCADGRDTATLTGSGYVGNTGNPSVDADMEAIFNNSYAVVFQCNGNHVGRPDATTDFTYGNYTVRVGVAWPGAAADAYILVFNTATMALNAYAALLANMTQYALDCDNFGDCADFSGAPTSSGGWGDFSGYNLDVA